MSDMICRKSMQRCNTPGMCSPHGGCQPEKSEWQSGYDEGRRMGTKHMYAEVDRLKAEIESLKREIKLSPELYPNTLRVKRDNAEYSALWMEWADKQISMRKDADRYRWFRDQKPNSLNLGRNSDHSSNYMQASEWIEQNPEWFDGTPEVDMAKMAETNTIWQLQIYPNTPVGFYVYCRSSLDDLIDAVMSEEAGNG